MVMIAVAIASGAVLVLSVVLSRTSRFGSKQVQVEPVAVIGLDVQKLAEHLSRAIRFQTISYQDSTRFDGTEFLGLHRYLEEAFPLVHSVLSKEVVGDYSILYTWKGHESQLKPVVLMAHTDVVPVESGTEEDWVHKPFEGRIADDCIWGRGALDDKAGVLGVLEAVKILLEEGFQPKRTVYLAFGHDEEVGGQNGAARITSLLRSRGIELEYVLDEGGFIMHETAGGIASPAALVGVAEKGYLSVELSVEGEGGHSSMPPRHTAIGILSSAICKLEKHQMKREIKGPVRQMYEYLGPELPFVKRLVFANLWLFGLLVKHKLAASPVTNALTRTTTSPTIVQGGVKENVLPVRARGTVNFRIHPSNSIDSVVDHVRKTVNDRRVKITPIEGSLTMEPSTKSSVQSNSFEILQRTIRQIFPDVVVAPYLVLGATDSRHYRSISDKVFQFTPLRMREEESKMVHGTNERLSIENYAQCIRFYIQLLRNSAV